MPSEILAGYLSESEFAADLGKSKRTVQRWREQRIGPNWTEIGNSIFYRNEPLELIAQGTSSPLGFLRRTIDSSKISCG